MALSLFKILTIFGNLQRAVNHSLKWLKKACSARLYFTIKTAFIKKCDLLLVGQQQNICRTSAMITTINAVSLSQSWLAAASNLLLQELNLKKEATMGNFLCKRWEEHGVTVHHVVNMLTRNTISHIFRPLMTIHSEWFSSCFMLWHLH